MHFFATYYSCAAHIKRSAAREETPRHASIKERSVESLRTAEG